MLEKEELKEIAKLKGLTLYQQEKHYVQSSILSILSDYPLIFKGGTYLWFFHGLNRFSTDLDFTLEIDRSTPKTYLDVDIFSKHITDKVCQSLWLFQGIKATGKIQNTTTNSFSFKIAAEGPLHTTPNSLCYVDVDISLREKIINVPKPYNLNFPEYNFPIKIIKGMDVEEVFAEKIRAIITRKPVTKSERDIYDLWFLMSKYNLKINKETLKLINKKLSFYKMKFDKNVFDKKLIEKKSSFKDLSNLIFGELKDFNYYYKYILNNIYEK